MCRHARLRRRPPCVEISFRGAERQPSFSSRKAAGPVRCARVAWVRRESPAIPRPVQARYRDGLRVAQDGKAVCFRRDGCAKNSARNARQGPPRYRARERRRYFWGAAMADEQPWVARDSIRPDGWSQTARARCCGGVRNYCCVMPSRISARLSAFYPDAACHRGWLERACSESCCRRER